jgi:hypothetical protein
MSPLLRALKAKYRRPREVLRALGLDQSLLNIPRLALDSANGEGAPGDESDPVALRIKLEKLFAESLNGHALEKARNLLEQHLGGSEYDLAHHQDDDEETEEVLRERRKRLMAKVADWLATEKNLGDEEIFDSLRDFPKNGLEHIGGALAEDLEQVMKARHQRLAGDARRRRLAADKRFGTGRLNGSAIETAWGDQPPARRVAMDTSAAESFNDRFPGAMRIKYGHAL